MESRKPKETPKEIAQESAAQKHELTVENAAVDDQITVWHILTCCVTGQCFLLYLLIPRDPRGIALKRRSVT